MLDFHRDVEESGLSRLLWEQEHVGSNPTISTDWVHTNLTKGSVSLRCRLTGRIGAFEALDVGSNPTGVTLKN